MVASFPGTNVGSRLCEVCGRQGCCVLDLVVDGANKSVAFCAHHYAKCLEAARPTSAGVPRPVVTATMPAHSDVPDDEMIFRFMSGRLSLDLTATVGERWRRSFERLRTPSDVDRWLIAAGLFEREAEASAADLNLYRDLREAIYRAVRAAVTDGAVDVHDERLLNRVAALPPLAPTLSGRRLSWSGQPAAESAASTVARDAIDLLTSGAATRVRECASPECALLFVDMSRPGTRRWCSTDTCGNRARAATYRLRRR